MSEEKYDVNLELWRCVVSAFGKAVHALSRVGDALWLDPMVKGVSSTRSLILARNLF